MSVKSLFWSNIDVSKLAYYYSALIYITVTEKTK